MAAKNQRQVPFPLRKAHMVEVVVIDPQHKHSGCAGSRPKTRCSELSRCEVSFYHSNGFERAGGAVSRGRTDSRTTADFLMLALKGDAP